MMMRGGLRRSLERHGFVRYAADGSLCDAVREEARASLDAALASRSSWLPRWLASPVGSSIRTRTQRWDLATPATPAVLSALPLALAPARDLAEVVGADAALVQLSVVTSDAGAPPQEWHCDTLWSPGPPLYTFLVALQDIGPRHGPTMVWPGTHVEAFHGRPRDERSTFLEATTPESAPSKRGDVLLFDSRVYHAGGANTLGRRSLLSASFKATGADAGADAGTTDSLLPELRGRFVFGDFLDPPPEAPP